MNTAAHYDYSVVPNQTTSSMYSDGSAHPRPFRGLGNSHDEIAEDALIPMADDFEWTAVLARYNESLLAHEASQRRSSGKPEKDPRQLEVERARKDLLLATLRCSYADIRHTPLWAALVFSVSALALAPFRGMLLGSAFAFLISLCWAALHMARHD